METIGEVLKTIRLSKKLKLSQVSEQLSIDASLITRFEKGERIPSKQQLLAFIKLYKADKSGLLTLWLSQKIYAVIDGEEYGLDALRLAEGKAEYKPLSVLPKEALKEITKLKKELDKYRPIPSVQLENLKTYFKIEYTYNSNKIEGNTLSLKETALVVEKGITVNGKSLQEHLEAINHAEAVELIHDFVSKKVKFNDYFLKQIHALVLRGISKEYSGRYRHLNVRITGAKHMPPEPYLLEKLMEDYFMFYETNKNKLHPVILAAEMHERLLTIHPFIDGNGRTSRLVMNLILMNHGYPIAIISGDKSNRMDYYETLEKAQVDLDKLPFYHFIIDCVKNSLKEYLKIIK